jgi:hypothetical protein
MGASGADNLNNKAKRMLTNTFYSRESRHFSFEKYVQCHKDAHVMLQKLETEGYPALDDREKVRYLLDGIKSDKLQAAKSTI